MTSRRKYYVTIMCLLLLMAGTYSCQKEERETTSRKGVSGKDPDSRVADLLASMNMHHFTDPIKAPDFELNSVKGEKIALSQYRGKVVLLSFWATW